MTPIEICKIIDVMALIGIGMFAFWYFFLHMPYEVQP